MYLRHSRIRKDGKTHTYWRLVRSVRRHGKVVQETVAQLGELDAEGRAKARALDDRLYRALDRLLPHKEAIERHLKARLGELFALEYDLLLYDVTSTYFEGLAEGNALAQRGYSRDHRPDCASAASCASTRPRRCCSNAWACDCPSGFASRPGSTKCSANSAS